MEHTLDLPELPDGYEYTNDCGYAVAGELVASLEYPSGHATLGPQTREWKIRSGGAGFLGIIARRKVKIIKIDPQRHQNIDYRGECGGIYGGRHALGVTNLEVREDHYFYHDSGRQPAPDELLISISGMNSELSQDVDWVRAAPGIFKVTGKAPGYKYAHEEE